MRRSATLLACILTGMLGRTVAAAAEIEPKWSQIPGPGEDAKDDDWFARMTDWQHDPTAAHKEWIAAMRAWREKRLAAIPYNDSQYRRPDLLWTQRDFVQPQVMVEDRYLYDPSTRRYTVSRLLDDLDRRYGGVDSVLLWPVYPNIGIDNRNQWDLARDMPGGVDALRIMVAAFHERGVRVFFPTMPWDTGTRAAGTSHAEATARLLADTGADGINGDTLDGIPYEYRAACDQTGHAVALEPELSPKDDAMLAFNQQSWAYWSYPFVPMVSKWKWLEPRHMVHVCNRWAKDHTDDLQFAFFNGVGFESWENIWGYWNQLTPRDAQAVRRIASIYRALPDQVVSADWEPHVPTLRYGVYASRFPARGISLFTVVNRNDHGASEGILPVPHEENARYYDLWNGGPLEPVRSGAADILNFPLEAHGFGAVIQTTGASLPDAVRTLLETTTARPPAPLSTFPAEWHFLPQQLVPVASTPPLRLAPEGMVRIPGGPYTFAVRGVEIEGENHIGLDVQYPWEDSPRREHYHALVMHPFFLDRYSVTNAQFKRFLDATHYAPADAHNFLRHWDGASPRPGDEHRPVTWVSIEDARAYASWAGKRLPHEWEWQYAAQGTDGRTYPWGDAWDAAAVPSRAKGADLPAPDPVEAHPGGASPFGIEDLVGNVWQWTDEYADDHTRAAVIRGGSFYEPQNSYWYFPRAYKLTEHGKYLLMAPSKDRSGTLGFRCAADAR